MESTRFSFLFDKYIHQSCTDAELNELMYLINQSDYDEELDNAMHTLWNSNHSMEKVDAHKKQHILRSILQPQKVVPIVQKNGYSWYRTGFAAAAVILLISFVYFFFSYNAIDPQKVLAQHDIPAGTNCATLTLADGSTIDLNAAQTGRIANGEQVSITKTSDGQLIYNIKARTTQTTKLAYNTLTTPKGGQYQVNLPDGTRVWLNSASSLRFPEHFGPAERRVELSGQGYFEVAHNKAMPFKVVSNLQEVEVLGTHFDVSSYPDDRLMKTTLLQGSVKVSLYGKKRETVLLKPGQQSVLTTSGTMKVSLADVEQAIGWKEGDFVFHSAPLDQIMKELGRWYDIEVNIANGVDRNQTYSGSISRSKPLSAVLIMLKSSSNIKFNIKNRVVSISPE